MGIELFNRPVEVIIENGDPNKVRGVASAKDMRDWLGKRIAFFAQRANTDLEFAFRQALQAYNSFHPIKTPQIEEIIVEGWKGEGDIEITEQLDYFKIKEPRKNKESGQIYWEEHLIPKQNVATFWKLMCQHCHAMEEYKYQFLVRMLLEHYKFHEFENQPIEQFIQAFNGGSHRAKYYFPYLYYPIKILEKKGYLKYFGRGGVMMLERDISITQS